MSDERRSPRRKARKKGRGWQVALLIFLLLLLVMLVGGYAVFHHYYSLLRTAPTEPVTVSWSQPEEETEDTVPSPLPLDPGESTPAPAATPGPETISGGETKDVYNILLLGIDNRADAYTRRNDATVLLTINKTDRRITATSFIREGRIWIPGWGYQRLNVANVYGGPELVLETIEYNYGIVPDNYLMVNIYAFMEIVDAVGGVDVSLTPDEVYFINTYASDSPGLALRDDGIYHLTGQQAMYFCRDRHIGTNIERTVRQERMIGAAIEKVKTLSLGQITSVAEIALRHTVSDIDESTLLSLLSLATSLKSYRFEHGGIPLEGTWEYATIEGGSYIVFDMDVNREYVQNIFYGMDP